jgi:hypothetical protein
MDKEYLLMFKIKNAGFDYEWFDTEEELRSRIKQLGNLVEDIEALHIKDVEQLDI